MKPLINEEIKVAKLCEAMRSNAKQGQYIRMEICLQWLCVSRVGSDVRGV